MGTKGLQLKQGVVTPSGEDLKQALNLWGPAIKQGDPAHISFVQIKDDHIHFEVNGGPVHRKKWYQHIEVSGSGGRTVTPATSDPPADVGVVRMVGDEVVRVETMKVGGEKIVRTEKEVVLPRADKDKDKEAKKEPGERPANAPSLRRPGEDSENAPKPEGAPSPV